MSQIWQVNTLWKSQSSRSHHDDAHLPNLTNDPLSVNLLHLPESKKCLSQDFQIQSQYNMAKGQIKITPLCCTPKIPKQCPNHLSISYTLQFPRYSSDKILKVKWTTARSKVISRSHHDLAHLQPPTNVPTKYHISTPYGFQDIERTRFYRSRSLQQGQRSNQGQGHYHKVKAQIKVTL